MSDYLARAQLVQLRIGRLHREVQTCSDLERIRAIGAEVELLLRSLENIREEQLIASMRKPKTGWRRLLWWRRSDDG